MLDFVVLVNMVVDSTVDGSDESGGRIEGHGALPDDCGKFDAWANEYNL